VALHGNYTIHTKSNGRWFGGSSTAHASGIASAQVYVRDNWGRGGARRNWAIQDGSDTIELLSIPAGYSGEGWLMPITAGSLSAHETITCEARLTAAGARGVNAEATIESTSSLSGTAALVVSGSAALTGTGALSGNIVAALAASGALSASGSLSGTSVAKGFMSSTLTATGSLSLTSYAVGYMSASIQPPTQLEAAEFSSYVLDTENVETGLTVRNALRLIAAATAGELSGAASTTITIRNAVADDKDRIVATVTSDGNRTAITYDLTDS
jgi:hypothetical protein